MPEIGIGLHSVGLGRFDQRVQVSAGWRRLRQGLIRPDAQFIEDGLGRLASMGVTRLRCQRVPGFDPVQLLNQRKAARRLAPGFVPASPSNVRQRPATVNLGG